MTITITMIIEKKNKGNYNNSVNLQLLVIIFETLKNIVAELACTTNYLISNFEKLQAFNEIIKQFFVCQC